MISDPANLNSLQARSVGTLARGVLRRNESIDAVWKHICSGLEALAETQSADHSELNENGLTQRLVDELEGLGGYRPYYFHKEFMENELSGKSPRSDIAVVVRKCERVIMNGRHCAGGKLFLALEAKRLPTPGTDREKEYLTGESGGVARFKLGLHARALKMVGLIGYVQRHAFSYWQEVINGWIGELIPGSAELPWDEKDKLQLEEESPLLARFRSSNLRVSDNQRLVMRHVWVKLAAASSLAQAKSRVRQAKRVRR